MDRMQDVYCIILGDQITSFIQHRHNEQATVNLIFPTVFTELHTYVTGLMDTETLSHIDGPTTSPDHRKSLEPFRSARKIPAAAFLQFCYFTLLTHARVMPSGCGGTRGLSVLSNLSYQDQMQCYTILEIQAMIIFCLLELCQSYIVFYAFQKSFLSR